MNTSTSFSLSALRGLVRPQAGFRLFGLTALLGLTLPLHAATMTLDITGQLPSSAINNYFQHNGGIAGMQWVPAAASYIGGISANDPFSFSFTYDSTALATNTSSGLRFGLSLVSGEVGNTTDFAGWDASAQYGYSSGGIITLNILMQKMVFDFPNPLLPGRDQYISAHFLARFADPNFLPGISTLPAVPFSLADLSMASAEFRYQGGDAGGQEYAFWRSTHFTGLSGGLMQGDPAPSPVPEGGTTILLLGAAGLLLIPVRRLRAA